MNTREDDTKERKTDNRFFVQRQSTCCNIFGCLGAVVPVVPHSNSVGVTFTINAQVQSFSDGHVCRKENTTVLGIVRDGQFDVVRRKVDTPSLLNLVKDFSFECTKRHVQLMGLENFCECEDGSLFFRAKIRSCLFPALIEETAIQALGFVKARKGIKVDHQNDRSPACEEF